MHLSNSYYVNKANFTRPKRSFLSLSNQASDKEWIQLHGKFLLNGSPSKVVIYVEGPPSGTDILLNSLVVKHAKRLPPSSPPNMEVSSCIFSPYLRP